MSGRVMYDPKPSMDRLVRFVDDQDSDAPLHVMALALRAALSECGQEQAMAAAGLDDTPDPEATPVEVEAAHRFRWDALGRLYMANKVVRRITEYVTRLGERPAPAEPVTSRDEVSDAVQAGLRSAFEGSGRLYAQAVLAGFDYMTPDDWSEVLDVVLDRVSAAGFSITRDPAVCGDYPAPCNCDDPLIHDGRP